LADTALALDALLAEVCLDLPPAEAELVLMRLDRLARDLDQVADKLGAALGPDAFCRAETASGPVVYTTGKPHFATFCDISANRSEVRKSSVLLDFLAFSAVGDKSGLSLSKPALSATQPPLLVRRFPLISTTYVSHRHQLTYYYPRQS
jgi:hypothetical protein